MIITVSWCDYSLLHTRTKLPQHILRHAQRHAVKKTRQGGSAFQQSERQQNNATIRSTVVTEQETSSQQIHSDYPTFNRRRLVRPFINHSVLFEDNTYTSVVPVS